MKVKLKQMFREFIEYIEFPAIIYIYETNRIIAMNEAGVTLIGGQYTNMKQILGERADRRYSKELLNNGSQILYNRRIIINKKEALVDIEVNSIPIDENHIIICLIEMSGNGVMLEPLSGKMPRIFWKNKKGFIEGSNSSYAVDFQLTDVKNGKYRSENFLEDDEMCEQSRENENYIISEQCSMYDVIQTMNTQDGNTFFVKMHRIPLINKNGTALGFLGIYNIILNQNEGKNIKEMETDSFDEKGYEGSEVFLGSWLKIGRPVEAISSQIMNYGYNQADFLKGGIALKDIVVEDDYDKMYKNLKNYDYNSKELPVLEYRLIKSDKKVVWIREQVVSFIEKGKEKYIESVLSDITAEKAMEIELIQSREFQKNNFINEKKASGKVSVYFQKIETILNKMDSMVFVIEKAGRRILYANEAVTNAYGDEIIGRGLDAFLFEKEISSFLLSDNSETNDCIITELYDKVNRKYYSIRHKEILWLKKNPAYIINMFDVTNLIMNRKGTELQTNNDLLTGLYNRNKFIMDFEIISRNITEKDNNGYVILIDLDDFKQFNEKAGYENGDSLLKTVAKYFMNIPMVKGRCYRIGGDEFVLILHNISKEDLLGIIDELIKRYKLPWRFNEKEYYCTLSMGIVQYSKYINKAIDLLKRAFSALNEARNKGNCQYCLLEADQLSTYKEPENIEKYLKKAVKTGCVEFEVYYQPIVDSLNKKITGVEALLRWKSEELGIINPSEFIPLTEYMGLIVPLGEFVLKEAFEICQNYNTVFDETLKMHINLSVVQLVQPDIIDRILEIVRLVGVNPENIVFEVTESLAIDDMVLMEQVLSKFRNKGFSVALDNFGSGYSAINHIMNLPLDYIKVDKSIINNYGTEKFNPEFFNAIIELAHSMKIKVIIEGVETKKQVEFLTFLSADGYQGYYYVRPVCKEDLKEYLKNNNGIIENKSNES